ncbi:DUF1071 domain-containing protein [Staphylococcus gallinarum]|uniref:Putative phage topoisomerase n=1 Tax=Staphylococcus gallinarum TaxID=1293 RepID=A0A0D0QTL5_STAGA|nr:DUF1071 domain-containing protein [Staphylococcus gallinarum]KIR10411.1 hypothetical protein SH09_13195 [Staphylococcus gallinarum]RTX78572.1 DUF1071 domain-containing protein [Staphylococcus gallinarum]GEQ07106.1 hypothetical protein SGA02_29340 [Staphylococcus gallinarum]SUM34072.1 putative phage topoisomerase [Staphylococcus gallinarum]
MNFIEHFNDLNSRDVSAHTEKKNGLNYLSWAYVQQELTKLDENFQHRFIEFPTIDNDREDIFLPYLKTEEGYMVCAEITLFGVTKREWLPVLNYKNQTIPKGSATTFDINKSMKRAFVKCAAQFGLGNYLYLGEDAPDARESDVSELEDKIAEFVRISQEKGRDATLEKTMRWLRIENINKLSGKDLADANAKLDAGLKQLDKETK